MHPILGECFSGDALRLCYLVLMMREDEIHASHMDIDLLAKSPEITSTTLYMPSWPSFQRFFAFTCLKIGFPEILPISGIISFPESEVTDTFFFIFILLHARASFHAFHVEVGEVTIIFEALDIKIYGTVITDIGMFLVDQFLCHADHLWNQLGNWLKTLEARDIEFLQIFVEEFCVVLRKCLE